MDKVKSQCMEVLNVSIAIRKVASVSWEGRKSESERV